MNPYHHLTIIGIIVVCAIVFAGEQVRHTSFAEDYGAVPAAISPEFRALAQGDLSISTLRNLSRLVTAIFLHGGPEHIIFNMVFLWTFGYLNSQTLGQWWALVIFLVCGIIGNVAQVILEGESQISIIGASGAISGFEGAYLGLAMRWQLPWPEVWPLAHPVPPMQLGAFAILGFLGDMFFLANHGNDIA
jgi:membrane associated rhomboid family serine protease